MGEERSISGSAAGGPVTFDDISSARLLGVRPYKLGEVNIVIWTTVLLRGYYL